MGKGFRLFPEKKGRFYMDAGATGRVIADDATSRVSGTVFLIGRDAMGSVPGPIAPVPIAPHSGGAKTAKPPTPVVMASWRHTVAST